MKVAEFLPVKVQISANAKAAEMPFFLTKALLRLHFRKKLLQNFYKSTTKMALFALREGAQFEVICFHRRPKPPCITGIL